MPGALFYSCLRAARQINRHFCEKLRVLKHVLRHEETGQDLVEYALLVSLVALGAVACISRLATTLAHAFSGFGTKLGAYTS